MSYFLPSYLQKRILRYALSQIELLDTDALDLDNLAIGWGRQSTVELREVGVHTTKLAALLRLPPALAIVSARILSLRLTVPADLYKSGILVEVNGVKVCVNADLEDQELGQEVRSKVHKNRPKKVARAFQGHKPRHPQFHLHDPGGARPPSEDDAQKSGHIPTPVDLAKSFLHTEIPIGEEARLRASVTDSQYSRQSQISSGDGHETPALGVGNNLALPAFLADFLKGVGDRIQLKVREVELDLTLKVDDLPESSSSSDASDRWEEVTIRLGVDSIYVDGAMASETTSKGADSEKTSGSSPQYFRRITLSNIEAMVISEATLFSNLARSTAPSSPETTQASRLAKFHSKTSPAAMSHADPREDPFSQSLETSNMRSGSEKLPVPESTDDRTEQAVIPQYAGNEYLDSMLADPFSPCEQRIPDGEEPMGDSRILPESLSYNNYAGYMNTSQSSVESRYLYSGQQFNGEETPPATFSVFDTVSPPEDATNLHFGLGLQDQRVLSSHSPTEAEVGRVSKSSYPGSDRSSPASEDLAQSNIFTHEEASMYMSAISQASDAADRNTSIPDNWASSDSGDESRERTSDTSTEPAIVYGHGHEPLRQAYKSGSGPVPEDLPKHVSSNYKASKVQSARDDGIHSSEPVANIQVENESSATSAKKGVASFPSSETSSANLKSSFTIAKRIFTVDTVVVVLPLSPNPIELPGKVHSQRYGESSQTMPGEFGQVLESSVASITTSESSGISEDPQDGKTCSVKVEKVQILADMGLTRMLILLSQQMHTSLHSRPPNPKSRAILNSPTSKNREWRVTIKEVSWKFLDAVKGKPVSRARHESAKQDGQPFSGNFSGDSEVLLRASIEQFEVIHSETAPLTSTTTISVGKVSFGYRSDKILSFNSEMKMRHSTRDVLSPVGKDVILTITRSPQSHKYELRTLPVHVALDLRRLDETFSWFGGFSSMLGLGSSMMSTMTVVDTKSKSSRSSKSTRGVHFESRGSSRSTRFDPIQPQSKVTARIGGLVFDVEGTQFSLRFESTAMKLVTRSEGLGLQVDRLIFSGPCSKQTSSEPTIMVKVTNLRIEYLPTPQEVDLTRLLEFLSPSKVKDARDDDILLDRLFLQRKQGAVVRTSIEKLDGNVTNLHDLHCFPMLSEDFKNLSTVTKYLPEDDRAGMLILGSVKDLRLAVTVNSSFGLACLACKNVEGAHVTFPSLTTLSIGRVNLHRNNTEELLGGGPHFEMVNHSQLPAVMVRFVGNEMEPTAKIKFFGLRIEYHVSTAMAVMGLEESNVTESIIAEMVSSVATLTKRQTSNPCPPTLSKQTSESSEKSTPTSKTLRIDISFNDSIIGLNPRKSLARGLIVLTDTHFLGDMPRDKEASAVLEVRKASIMVVDSVENITPTIDEAVAQKALNIQSTQIQSLLDMGYVSVGTISAAKATIQVIESETEPNKAVDIEIRDELFVLETCADSTQTIQSILNGLSPPTPPSAELRYRTEVVPVEDMLASFTGDVFATTRTSLEADESSLGLDGGDMMNDEVPRNLEFVTSFYNPGPDAVYDEIANSMLEDDLDSLASPSMVREIGDKNLLESFEDQAQVAPGNEPLEFQEGHFGARSSIGDTAHTWDTDQDTYGLSGDKMLQSSPLRVRVRDVHFIWNLFDGYDWQYTRDAITQAVEAVQIKATERLSRKDKRKSVDPEEEEESVIGDFLFNSIYIGIPANRDPRELTRQVNRNLDDLVSEPESNATSTTSGSPSGQGHVPRPYSRKLRLKRSQYHKMTFELKGVSADLVVFPPKSGETQSSIDVRIQDLEIFDHVPTSTWKKFATYMHDAGERESGASMIHIEILNVKPVPDLAASEIIMKATVLPLRLHVDQDALDFLTRFFEFKDDTALVQASKPEPPFFQRVEVNSIQVKLDFKPKRVDYAGIRSGHSTEFMNFFILDRADMVLRHVILRGGISGFEKVGNMLNDIWMPDIKRNQLPGILAGLAPVRSLVNVGGGVRDLVAIPIREYRKDGRVVRSFQKGAVAFARTTTGELVKLGAKLAIGTQTMLQGAEDLLAQPSTDRSDVSGGWEDAELDEEEKKQISLYADQPIGVVQGLRGAYASLERDLLTAKDAIVAIPGEMMESGTARGAAKAVLRGAPTIILRPAMGVSKAVGQTLMGATNSLDPGNRRRIEDKYKRH